MAPVTPSAFIQHSRLRRLVRSNGSIWDAYVSEQLPVLTRQLDGRASIKAVVNLLVDALRTVEAQCNTVGPAGQAAVTLACVLEDALKLHELQAADDTPPVAGKVANQPVSVSVP